MSRSHLRSAWLTAGLLPVLVAGLAGVAAASGAAAPSPAASPPTSASPATSPAPATTSPSPATTSPSPATTSPSPATAGPFATVLTLGRSESVVLYGSALPLAGRLTLVDGTPVADAAVQLLARTAGQPGVIVLTTFRTGSDGRLAGRVLPRTTAEYQLRYGGDALNAPALSVKTVTAVQPRVSGTFAPAGLKLGETGVLQGAVAPAYYGTRLSIRRRFADGSWRDVAAVGVDGSGAYAWAVRPGLVGRYVFQVVLPSRPAHLPAQTPPLALQVDPRDLTAGDTGGDVLALQQRLAAQRLDVGAIDGTFGYDLTHAVLAFQKAQDLPRTGLYDSATRARLGAPTPIRLRAPAAGRAIEIDLRRQVLLVSEAGVLQRILDVSTGSGQLYQENGVTYRASTPLGRFAIQRKIDDPHHVSPLGVLYRPAFFYQGWAIHGSGSVPAYPASHGCVRITDPAMDRLYGLLAIGTPVTVYGG